jgi:MFS transporter, Spinster family, sphingosine-1-phosphate transporter
MMIKVSVFGHGVNVTGQLAGVTAVRRHGSRVIRYVRLLAFRPVRSPAGRKGLVHVVESAPRVRRGGWRFATARPVFWLLFSVNLVNYLDRLLAVAVGPTLKHQFNLLDRDIGRLSSAFLIVYTLSTLPLGLLADRAPRAKVVSICLAFWSLVSMATAGVRSFFGLFITRAGVGVGEAGFFPAGMALLSAYYPLEARARAIGRWGAGQVVGSALAFALGGAFLHWFGRGVGWRLAFLVAGVPGLVLAVLVWRVEEHPGRTGNAAELPTPAAAAGDWRDQLRAWLPDLVARTRQALSIPTVRFAVALQAMTYIVVTPMVTFLPIYLRSRHSPFQLTDSQAALLAGVPLVVGGIAGTLLGGPLADWLGARVRGGRLLAIGAAFGLSVPGVLIILLTHSLVAFVLVGTLAVLTLNLQVGPLGAVLQDVTPPRVRASIVALAMLTAHLLSDTWAPTTVGEISTRYGERPAIGLLAIGLPTLLLAVGVAVWGRRAYADDVALRVREAGGD